ncbi:sn-glycerol-3-phosphate-binding periplasmic protein UgpB [Ensifer psoraleae]|uniref:ABC transporter substrate-binding protein n=1 Tax=Sinorhizobium psoraleae TaxID=520838 RepID=UPI0015699296|nr:ABC transporter substrate-binding protein [Sinorhizobium psoraleae]NRP70921.1 sn-glycerol-3-phosphate-binding periplasmic protein UgpB [Sinorhizobium psoraleae]
MRLPRLAAIASLFTLVAPAALMAETITLSVIHGSPPGVYQEVTKRFMEEHPQIQVELEAPALTAEDVTQRVIRGSLIGATPDVAFQGFNQIRTLGERDLAVSLEPFISSEKDWNSLGYIPSMLDLAKFRSKTLGLPFGISTPIIYYNADLVRRAGGDPSRFPSDWHAITELAKRIQAIGDGTMGIYFQYYDVSGNWTFFSLIQSLGGDIMSKDEKAVAFDGPIGLKALEIMRSIAEAGQVEMTSAQASQAFEAGKLGIFIRSSVRTAQLEEASKGKFTLSTAPFPILANDGRLPVGGTAAVMLTQDSSKQAAAWEYIKFVTGPIGQTIAAKSTGYAPGNMIAAKEKQFLGGFYATYPNYMTSINQLPDMTSWYAFPGENSLKITDTIRDHLQSVMTLKSQPDTALKAMVSDIKALLP